MNIAENDHEYDPLGLTIVDGEGDEFVAFMLEGEEYACPITNVQEIIGFREVTKLPNVPPFIIGVLNLRGAVVPVVDLRSKFGLPAKEYDKYTVIVIVEVGDKVMGIVVDSVTDVLRLSDEEIQPAPDFAGAVDSHLITGMADKGGKFIVLLDVQRMLSNEELEGLKVAA
ncbi:MAG: chemotaxis protein CheW [Proteobacteria bacterium]|nr:MAG: chemotaxis protein CheW [Pseudomonadota bacterium]